MDTFQLRPDLPKVLNIICLHTEFGLGRFTPSIRGPDVLAIIYLTWRTIWGCPEACLTERGSEVENDAFINSLKSMGVHWRASPTEAPWGIGRNKRQHEPIRDAFLRILAQTPTLSLELALVMAYKGRNDAPRAHGASPTTATTGDQPRLIIGPNHRADPSVSARARAMHAARNSMEKYTAADGLRGALSHTGTSVPLVERGREVWSHLHCNGWLRGTVSSLDGKTVYVRRNGLLFSSHESRTKPYVSRTPPTAPAAPSSFAASASTLAPPASAPIRTHSPAPPPPASFPPRASVFLSRPANPESPSHPRWDAAKVIEIAVFAKIDCKTPSRPSPQADLPLPLALDLPN